MQTHQVKLEQERRGGRKGGARHRAGWRGLRAESALGARTWSERSVSPPLPAPQARCLSSCHPGNLVLTARAASLPSAGLQENCSSAELSACPVIRAGRTFLPARRIFSLSNMTNSTLVLRHIVFICLMFWSVSRLYRF